jgi:hypothetical protein
MTFSQLWMLVEHLGGQRARPLEQGHVLHQIGKTQQWRARLAGA